MNVHPTVAIADTAMFATLQQLVTAVDPTSVVLIGGWAVRARLAEHHQSARPTRDLDALLHASARPAMKSLQRLGADQIDPAHAARLSGLPLDVDILTSHPDSGRWPIPNNHDIPQVLEDSDHLRLAVPNMARLLATRHSPMTLTQADAEIQIAVARPGALLAAKLTTLGSEGRAQEKRYSDAEDTIRLLTAVPPETLHEDLATMTPQEQAAFTRVTDAITGQQLARLAAHGGHDVPAYAVEVLISRYQMAVGHSPSSMQAPAPTQDPRRSRLAAIRQTLRSARRQEPPTSPYADGDDPLMADPLNGRHQPPNDGPQSGPTR